MVKNKKNGAHYQEEPSPFDWMGLLGGFFSGFMKSATDSFLLKVKDQIKRVSVSLQKNIWGTYFVMLGTAFLATGLSKIIEQFVVFPEGLGYGIIGLLILIGGLITIKK